MDKPIARNTVQKVLRSAREASSAANVFDDNVNPSRDGENVAPNSKNSNRPPHFIPSMDSINNNNSTDPQDNSNNEDSTNRDQEGNDESGNEADGKQQGKQQQQQRVASKPRRPIVTLGEMVRRHDFRGLDKYATPFLVDHLNYERGKDTASIALGGNPHHRAVMKPTFSRNPARPKLAGDNFIGGENDKDNNQHKQPARGYGFGASPSRVAADATKMNDVSQYNHAGRTQKQSAYFPVKGDFPQQPPADLNHLVPPSQDLARHLFSSIHRSGLASIGISQDAVRMLWPGFTDSSMVDRAFAATLKKREGTSEVANGAMRFEGFFPMLRCVAFMNNVQPLFKMMNRDLGDKITKDEFLAFAPQLRLKEPESEFDEIDQDGEGEISIEQLCSFLAENPARYADLQVNPLMALQNASDKTLRKKNRLGKLNKNHANLLAASQSVVEPSSLAQSHTALMEDLERSDELSQRQQQKGNRASSEDKASARSAPVTKPKNNNKDNNNNNNNNNQPQPPQQSQTPRHARVAQRRAQHDAERLEKLRALAAASDDRVAELRRKKEQEDRERAEAARLAALALQEAHMALSNQLDEEERLRLAEEAMELERRQRERELADQKRKEAYARGQAEREAMLQAQAEKLAAERAKAEEEAKARREAALKAKRDKEDAEKQKKEQEELDKKRQAELDKKRKEKLAEERKKRSEEAAKARAQKEAEEKAEREEAARRRAEEDRLKKEKADQEKAEKDAKKKAELEKRKKDEAEKKAREMEVARQKAEDDAARKEQERLDAEEKKKKDDAEAAARKAAEDEKKKLEAEAAAAKKKADDEEKQKQEAADAEKKKAEEDKKKADDAEKKKLEESRRAEQSAAAVKIQSATRQRQARGRLQNLKKDRADQEAELERQAAEAEETERKKADEEEAAKKRAEEEAAAKQKAEEEEAAAARKKKAEQEAAAKEEAAAAAAAAKQKADEEAAKKKKADDEKKKVENESAAAQKIQGATRQRQARGKLDTLKKAKAEEEAAAKKKAEEEAAAKKKADEEAAAKQKADEEAAKNKADEEAAAKKKAEEETAAKRKAEEEAAAKQKAEEEAAAKKKAEEEEEAARQDAARKAAAEKAIADAKAKKEAEEAARKRKEEEARLAAEKAAADKEEARKQAIRDRFNSAKADKVQPHHLIMSTEKRFFSDLFEFVSDFRQPPEDGVSEEEFKQKAVNIKWPGNTAKSAAARSWLYCDKNGKKRIPTHQDFMTALQFVVYANNLQPLFDNVDANGTGTLDKEEFDACASQFEIEDSEAAFKDMIKYINEHLKMSLPADSDSIPFDLYCYWLSREKPFFDVEVEVTDVAVPEDADNNNGSGGVGDGSFTGTFEVAESRRQWKTQPPSDLDNLELPRDSSLLSDLWHFLDKNETNFIDLQQFDTACTELWPGFANKSASKSAFNSVHHYDTGDKIHRKRFARALQYVVYANNLYSLFDEVDADGNKRVDKAEFVAIAEQFQLHDADAAFEEMDTRKKGFVSFEQFCEWVTNHKEEIEKANAGGDEDDGPDSPAATITQAK